MFFQGFDGTAKGARRVHNVVDDDAVASLNVADNMHDLGFIRTWTAFIDNGQIGSGNAFSNGAGANDAANIRRDHHDVFITILIDIFEHDWRAIEVVYRHV